MKIKSFISREQDYALRITTFLAGQKEGEFISVNKMAEKLHISKKFASRIVHKLKHANITGSIQGKYGGVFLKADPKEISIWDIMNICGFKVKFNDCMNEFFFCELQFGCRFHNFFLATEKALFDNLKKQKISDFLFLQINDQ